MRLIKRRPKRRRSVLFGHRTCHSKGASDSHLLIRAKDAPINFEYTHLIPLIPIKIYNKAIQKKYENTLICNLSFFSKLKGNFIFVLFKKKKKDKEAPQYKYVFFPPKGMAIT